MAILFFLFKNRRELFHVEQKFYLFEYRFNNEELENEFNDFFHANNLNPLFTNEHMAGSITVTYVDAKSVLNEGGSYQKTLKDFAELLTLANDNKSFEEAMFRIIYEARSFQGMMRKLKELVNFIKTVDERNKHNIWNIVWYKKDLK